MKNLKIIYLFSILLLSGCQTEDIKVERNLDDKDQFGSLESEIPIEDKHLLTTNVLEQIMQEPFDSAFSDSSSFYMDDYLQAESIGKNMVESSSARAPIKAASNAENQSNSVYILNPFAQNDLWVFHRGNSSANIFTRVTNSSPNSTPYANGPNVPGQIKGSTGRGADAVRYNNEIYVFHSGNQNEKIYYTKSSDGTIWTPSAEVASNIDTKMKPTAIEFNGLLYVFHLSDTDNDQRPEVYCHVGNGNVFLDYGVIPNSEFWNNNVRSVAATTYYNAALGSEVLVLFYPDNTLTPSGVNRVQISYTADGNNWFKAITNIGETLLSLEAINFENEVYLFGVDQNVGIDMWKSADPLNSNSWSSKRDLFPSFTATDVSATVHIPRGITSNQESIRLAWSGNQTNNLYSAYSYNGFNFSQIQIGGQCKDATPAIIDVDGDGFEPPTPSNVNIALNSTVSASSTFPSYSASRAIDNSTNTTVGGNYSWTNNHPAGGNLPEWLRLDFGSVQSFDRVKIYTSAGYEIQDYKVQVSNNNSTWTTVVNVTGNTSVMREHNFSVQNARYLRVYCTKGPSNQVIYARINELQVFTP